MLADKSIHKATMAAEDPTTAAVAEEPLLCTDSEDEEDDENWEDFQEEGDKVGAESSHHGH